MEAAGAWVSAFEEWKEILESEDDGRLYAAMLGEMRIQFGSGNRCRT